jgi:hypothetical protein
MTNLSTDLVPAFANLEIMTIIDSLTTSLYAPLRKGAHEHNLGIRGNFASQASCDFHKSSGPSSNNGQPQPRSKDHRDRDPSYLGCERRG